MSIDDFDEKLAREFDDLAPGWAAEPSVIVRAGRRRRRARRIGLAGGGVAAVTAIALAVGLTAGGTGATPVAAAVPSPTVSEPPEAFPAKLEPGTTYWWVADDVFNQGEGGQGTETEETRAFGEALTRELAARGAVKDFPGDADELRVVSRTTYLVPVGRADLTRDDALFERAGYDGEWTGHLDGRADIIDKIGFEAHPAGTYLRGTRTSEPVAGPGAPDPRYLAEGCDPVRMMAGGSVTYECATRTGPDGELIIMVTANVEGGPIEGEAHTTAVMYRTDGSAVRLVDQWWLANPKIPASTALSADDLADILLRLPKVPVK